MKSQTLGTPATPAAATQRTPPAVTEPEARTQAPKAASFSKAVAPAGRDWDAVRQSWFALLPRVGVHTLVAPKGAASGPQPPLPNMPAGASMRPLDSTKNDFPAHKHRDFQLQWYLGNVGSQEGDAATVTPTHFVDHVRAGWFGTDEADALEDLIIDLGRLSAGQKTDQVLPLRSAADKQAEWRRGRDEEPKTMAPTADRTPADPFLGLAIAAAYDAAKQEALRSAGQTASARAGRTALAQPLLQEGKQTYSVVALEEPVVPSPTVEEVAHAAASIRDCNAVFVAQSLRAKAVDALHAAVVQLELEALERTGTPRGLLCDEQTIALFCRALREHCKALAATAFTLTDLASMTPQDLLERQSQAAQLSAIHAHLDQYEREATEDAPAEPETPPFSLDGLLRACQAAPHLVDYRGPLKHALTTVLTGGPLPTSQAMSGMTLPARGAEAAAIHRRVVGDVACGTSRQDAATAVGPAGLLLTPEQLAEAVDREQITLPEARAFLAWQLTFVAFRQLNHSRGEADTVALLSTAQTYIRDERLAENHTRLTEAANDYPANPYDNLGR